MKDDRAWKERRKMNYLLFQRAIHSGFGQCLCSTVFLGQIDNLRFIAHSNGSDQRCWKKKHRVHWHLPFPIEWTNQPNLSCWSSLFFFFCFFGTGWSSGCRRSVAEKTNFWIDWFEWSLMNAWRTTNRWTENVVPIDQFENLLQFIEMSFFNHSIGFINSQESKGWEITEMFVVLNIDFLVQSTELRDQSSTTSCNNSQNRPGVATMISGFWLRRRSCFCVDIPPTITAV